MIQRKSLLFLALIVLVSSMFLPRQVKAETSSYFGNQNIGSVQAGYGTYMLGDLFTIPTNGNVTTISIYLRNTDSSAHNVKAAIYRSALYAVAPYNLVGNSSVISLPGSFGPAWQNFSLVNFTALGQQLSTEYAYVLVWWADNAAIVGNQENSGGNEFYNTGAYQEWMNPLVYGNHVFLFSIYATLTTDSTPASPPLPGSTEYIILPAAGVTEAMWFILIIWLVLIALGLKEPYYATIGSLIGIMFSLMLMSAISHWLGIILVFMNIYICYASLMKGEKK